ncbi:MAG: hypothetical protein AAF266_08810 [Planctomycetota bacterium]
MPPLVALLTPALLLALGVSALDATSPTKAPTPDLLAQIDAADELRRFEELSAADDFETTVENHTGDSENDAVPEWQAATSSDPPGGRVASDLPAALLKQWRISVVARVIGKTNQAITVRFSPRAQRDEERQDIDVLLTRLRDKPTPVRVNLSDDSRLVMLLDQVDADRDSVTITLMGEEIAGQPFRRDTLPVAID